MKLKMQDLRLFNIVFESDPGWILDFSNRTLSAFFDEELNIDSKRAARTVLTGMCYSVGSATRQGSSSLTRFIGQSAITSSTWRR